MKNPASSVKKPGFQGVNIINKCNQSPGLFTEGGTKINQAGLLTCGSQHIPNLPRLKDPVAF